MTFQLFPPDTDPSPHTAMHELRGAHDDLSRLSVLLNEAFGELLNSFSVVHLVASNGGDIAEIERSANRAITALQCGDMASQLIGFTQKRLTFVRETLKNEPQLPQIAMTNSAQGSGFSAGADMPRAGPVQQDAASPGTIDLF
ncbi:MAG: hypothetical protein ABL931_03220 [Usitatibacteraceae bacterium]